ncbi:uncharacterized protein BN903_168 [Halorubrum sp. AJ67]|nr:uncharacterized protein BN903_168 [Halorubrum sp. AJ67]
MWIPEAESDCVDGETYGQMPFWAVRKAAVALEICPEGAFIEREGENGTYKGFPGYETYNETLKAIGDAGLRHERDPISPEEVTDSEGRDKQDTRSDTASPDSQVSQLDQAHVRERNRLLSAKVDQLESELNEKTDRINMLETEVEHLQKELETVRSERDYLESALENNVLNQGSEQQTEEDPANDRSTLERARQFISFDQ